MESARTPDSLITQLDRLDIKLWVEGERLRYNAPPGALTPGLRAILQENKNDLMVLLRTRDVANQPRMGVVTAPPSFVQRHFWSLQQQDPAACCFNVPFAFHLRGKLDATVLRRSLAEIVGRHELLRTTLQPVDGTLMQMIAATGEVNMSVADLRDWPTETQGDEAYRLIQEELSSPFDLAREPCLRVRLLRLGDEEHLLLFCLHSVMGEDGSVGALLKELGVYYEALLAAAPGSNPEPLPPLPMQYADYAHWQQSLLSTGMEARLAYWRQWFARGEPPTLTAALAKSTPSQSSFRAGMVWHQFSPQLTDRLRRLSRSAGVTLFVTTIAGYAALLCRYSGCADVVVGGPSANRSHWKLEPLIGSTLNILCYRFDLAGNPDVLTLLARVRSTVVAALTHQDVPFAAIAPLLEPERQRTNPLFRTALTFSENMPHRQLQLAGVTVTFLERITNQETRPELFPVMWEDQTTNGALTSYWLYREDLFDAGTIEQMVADYEAMLTAMAADPRQTIEALPSSRGGAGNQAGHDSDHSPR
jgi:hypothetical protein